ncbi:tagatose-6-phosphate kinase [Aerococcus agrisoli]|uniref:Tagatose-6-phosphate kinase n=1 Tax=Aerococcus agrisoli TaxID=2487350 RepID=A0A3N4GBQ3_9LACT|nr:tagatose-6-phosphate kinase [Aerococcus agrisoli]RPA59348.1 tagatose-6-phosphate kinase [Aerococcus agrisoli]
MILTVTLNPSIDISYNLSTFQLDNTNRVTEVRKTAGGKGLNVSRVANELGKDVVATGFLGGKLGEEITEQLYATGIKSNFLVIQEKTRNCIAILHEGMQTEILEKGPTISTDEANQFLKHFDALSEEANVISMSGSLPNGLPDDYYTFLIERANQKNKKIILDSSGSSLMAVLQNKHRPSVIKPNINELSDILGYKLSEDNDSLKSALSTQIFDGIEWIIVFLGANGAFAKHHSSYYRIDIPNISVINPVGSGDSTVAGIAAALDNQLDDISLLKQAMTCGMLNTMESITGHIDLKNFNNLFNQVIVTKY